MAAHHYLLGSFSDHDRAIDRDARPFRVIKGGKAAKPRALRPLRAVEALCLAWSAGLVHSLWHEDSEVLIDEGSTPVDLPGECLDSGVRNILETRGYVLPRSQSRRGLKLTDAGRRELNRQIRKGFLSALKLPTVGKIKAGVEARASRPRLTVCWPGQRVVEVEPEYLSPAAYADECWSIESAEWGAS